MGVPKRKTSKSKIGARKGSHKLSIAAVKACPQCGAPHRPHRVCPSCGYYNGRQVMTVSTK